MTRKDLNRLPDPEAESSSTNQTSEAAHTPSNADATAKTPAIPAGLTTISPQTGSNLASSADFPLIPRGAVGSTETSTLQPTAGLLSDEDDVEARVAYESLMAHRKKRRGRRLAIAGVIGGIIIVAALINGAMTFLVPAAPPQPVRTATLSRSDFVESVEASGAAMPVSSVVVTPEVDGIIDTVSVAEGSVVNEGDQLLTLRNPTLDKTVREAELGLRTARTQLDQARSALSQARSAAQAASAAAGLEGAGMGNPQDAVDQAKSAVSAAELDVERAREAYNDAVALANKRTVCAPASGTVIVMNAVEGAGIGAAVGAAGAAATNGPLIQIADLSQMTVRVQVNEIDISRVAVGQTARVTFSALPGAEMDATVTRIATVATGSGSSGAAAMMGGGGSGVVTYEVELLIPQPAAGLRPGMTANVEIYLQREQNALIAPVGAVGTSDDGARYVYVQTDDEGTAFERRPVEVSAESTTDAVIKKGVAEGDIIAIDPYEIEERATQGTITLTDGTSSSSSDAAAAPDASGNGAGNAAPAPETHENEATNPPAETAEAPAEGAGQ